MKENFILFLIILFANCLVGQDYSYKSKEYDFEIFDYLMKRTESDSISLEEYLIYTKPFSKWDIRPLESENVWALDTIHSASTIPNFIWGSFANKFELTESEASDKPNRFINEGINKMINRSEFYKINEEKFKNLTERIKQSSNRIFLNQKSLQRVDYTYKENNQYWTYVIPKDSPFPISNKTEVLADTEFSKEQLEILELLSELKIYSAYKTDNKGVFLVIEGFTDNSYGFYFNSNGLMETKNKLFQILEHERLNNNYFYYVAN